MAAEFTFQPTALHLDPGRTLLLVVDMENEFCRPDGRAYLGARSEAAVDHTASMLARCRELGTPIIFVRSVREPDSIEFTAFSHAPFLLRGTEAVEFVEAVTPLAHEPVVEKHSHDPFNHTELEAMIERLGFEPGGGATVLVAGVATSVCVMCAVVGLSVRQFNVGLLTDCTASGTAHSENLAYELLSSRAYNYNVSLTTSGMVNFRVPTLA